MLELGLVGCRVYSVPFKVSPAYAAVGKLPVPGRGIKRAVPLPPYRVLLFTDALFNNVQPSIEKSVADGTDGTLARWVLPLKVTEVLGSLAIAPGDPSVGALT